MLPGSTYPTLSLMVLLLHSFLRQTGSRLTEWKRGDQPWLMACDTPVREIARCRMWIIISAKVNGVQSCLTPASAQVVENGRRRMCLTTVS